MGISIAFSSSGFAQAAKQGTKNAPVRVRPLIVMCTVINNGCDSPGSEACTSSCDVTKGSGSGDDGNPCGDADSMTSDCYPDDNSASGPVPTAGSVGPPPVPTCTEIYQRTLASTCSKLKLEAAQKCQQSASQADNDCEARAKKVANAASSTLSCSAIRVENTNYCISLKESHPNLYGTCTAKVQQAYSLCSGPPKPNQPTKPIMSR